MNWKLYLSICFLQVLLYTNAMENRDDAIELFLSIQLPFSVKRDEVVNVPVLVHNRQHYKIPVWITLDNSKAEYEFMDFDNKVISKPNMTKSIILEQHTAAKIFFLIRPIVTGSVTLKFRASTINDKDTIYKTLNVVPEGITQFVADAFLVNLTKGSEQDTDIALKSIEDIVFDSLHLEAGVVGDILGLVMKNLYSLVRLPTGCGEQTMSSLLPSYLVMKYLKHKNRLTPDLNAWLRHNLETGYENMLSCRHTDGSFSSFRPFQGKQNLRDGSTFVTSYILRFLPHFKEFININETVIEEGLAYLSKQQIATGKFTEDSIYLYPSQSNFVTLTGGAVLAFLENHAYADKYLQNITKGLEYMGNTLENYKFLHTHALATYAFKHVKYAASEKTSFIKWLSVTNIETQSKWWHYLYLSNFERTSFNLLKLLEFNSTKIDYTLPAVKRLIAQRKSLSDFAATIDTIVGLIDIIKLAEVPNYAPARMDVNFYSNNNNGTIKLTEDNENLYESIQLSPKANSVKIAAKGNGSAIIQFAFQYNTLQDQLRIAPSFTITTTKLYNSVISSYMTMLVCVNYVGEKESSEMAMLEIYTPSGYVISDANFKDTKKLKRVTNMELKNSGTLLVVYFDQLYKDVKVCLRVEASRTHNVAMQKPAPIIMYEYYDKEGRAVIFYNVNAELCDICTTREECRKCK